MFQYEVLSEQEAMAERFQLLKDGEYEGVITSSKDAMSSKGSPMMDMIVSVYDENGKCHEVRDFLVFTKPMMWKVVHFADSANVSKEYEAGKLCSEVVLNKRVMVKVGIENGGEIPADKLKGKPAGTRYFDKNRIEDYLKKGEQESVPAFEDDDVPFL
ncbi:MAG TPA: hypothetical protein ACFYDZ_00240 [Candidatus Brocadiaceae bacterium]